MVDYDAYQLERLHPPPPGPVRILDIGANVGTASVIFAAIPRAEVLACEPLPANGHFLVANLERNKLTRVHWLSVAVSRSDGEADFVVSAADNVGGRLAGSCKAGGYRITVQTMAWASLLREVGGWRNLFG